MTPSANPEATLRRTRHNTGFGISSTAWTRIGVTTLPGLRRCAAGRESERPQNTTQQMLLELFRDLGRVHPPLLVGVGRVPNILTMTERSVEDAAFPVHPAPRNRIIAGHGVFRVF